MKTFDVRKFLEEIYETAWKHGFENQVLMAPDRLFDVWEEKLKKVLDK